MARNDLSEEDGVSKLSRRGLLALGAMLTGASGLGTLSGTASAHGLLAFRDAFIGNDGDKSGLGSKGWLFFAKDTGSVYFHDGSGWQDLPVGGQLADTDSDGLLEAPNHDGIDVGTLETDAVHLGADSDDDGNEWRFDTDSSDTARIYSWDGGAATECLRFNESGPVEVKNAVLSVSTSLDLPRGVLTSNISKDATEIITESIPSGHFRVLDGNNSNVRRFQVNNSGPVEVANANLNLNGNDVNNVGTLNASTKNFVQDIGNGREAVYTSQEGPDVRAVVEGSVEVGPNDATVSLPDHFDAVTSDKNPDVTVQATPDELTQVACTSRSTTELTFEAADSCRIDYRVTALRDGYEDKEVVRGTRDNQTS